LPRLLSLHQVLVRDPAALAAEVDGEIVALDVARGVCFGLDAVASRIWGLIGEPTTPAQVCERLMADYEVSPSVCERDVLAFLETLRAEGLLIAPADPGPLAP
jgi:hypothetical protein